MLASKKVTKKAPRVDEYKEGFAQLFYNMWSKHELPPYEFIHFALGALLCMRYLNYKEYQRINCTTTHRFFDEVVSVVAHELAATQPEKAVELLERFKGTVE